MLANRPLKRLSIACAAMAMIAVSNFSPAAAQDSVTVHAGVEYLDWRKLPQTVVEGIAGSSPCGWLIIDTGTSHLIFRAGQEFSYHPPVGKHFVNFKPCLNYEGFRVRVTYTAATGNGYDGDFRILEVLAAVSPGKGDDVPRFADGPDPAQKLFAPKPEPRWVPPPKPWANATGVVNAVVCGSQGLTMVLNQSGFILKLHTDHYKGLPFYASGGTAGDGFNPCKELQGHMASVAYAPIKGKAYDGALASIEVKD